VVFGLSKRVLIVIGVLIVVVVIFVIQGRNPNNGQSTSDSGQCKVKVTANALNIRSSPATSAPVVGTFPSGQVINADKTVQNGFRQLNTNQWVSSQFVTPVSGSC
jgi:hypothetical protein